MEAKSAASDRLESKTSGNSRHKAVFALHFNHFDRFMKKK
jgi:hypothetical protein